MSELTKKDIIDQLESICSDLEKKVALGAPSTTVFYVNTFRSELEKIKNKNLK